MTKSGAFAALTNVFEERQSRTQSDGRPLLSRGKLVQSWLSKNEGAHTDVFTDLLEEMYAKRDHYGGFNLLVGEIRDSQARTAYVSNRSQEQCINSLEGAHAICGLSNTSLHDPWPKVKEGEHLVQNVLDAPRTSERDLIDRLFDVLQTKAPGVEHGMMTREDMPRSIHVPPLRLPSSADEMRLASAQEMKEGHMGWYATRTATVVLVTRTNQATFVEREMYTLTNDGAEQINYKNPDVRAHHERLFQWQLA